MSTGYKQTEDHIRKRTEVRKNGQYFNCQNCGNIFYRSKFRIEKGDCKFCSRHCYQQSSLNKQPKPYVSELRKKCIGEKSPSWKGGITPVNIKIRQSEEYKKWRLNVFERDNYTCVKCGFRSQKGKCVPIQAHHIKSFSNHPELRFELSNGETLCRDCHKKTDNYKNNKKYHK